MSTNRSARAAVMEVGSMTCALMLAGTLWAATPAEAQVTDPHNHASAPTVPNEKPVSPAPERATAPAQQKMMADDKAAAARLQVLIDTMNVSTGEAKVDAMAGIITELLAERAAMREHMASMSHMMKPEAAVTAPQGEPAGKCEMAEQCEMMKKGASAPKP